MRKNKRWVDAAMRAWRSAEVGCDFVPSAWYKGRNPRRIGKANAILQSGEIGTVTGFRFV